MVQYTGKIEPKTYMVGTEEAGHYNIAFQETLSRFKLMDPLEMAARSGTVFNTQTNVFYIKSFNQNIEVSYPEGKVTFSGTQLLPLMGWRLVILNYLVRADGSPATGRLISYRELEDGIVFYPAFQRESITGLSRRLNGVSPDILEKAYRDLGGVKYSGADLGMVLPALPNFPITVKLWFPDEELPGSANILFDATANCYLHTEDIAVIGGYAAAFPLIEYRILSGEPWRKTVL